VIKDFKHSQCGRDVLKAAMTQLLLYYTRMLELLKKGGPDGLALVRNAVTVPSIMYEIKRYNR
jgi:vacuolar protein sorting-associated protein 52